MEVRASCKYDLEAIRALTRLSMFKKADPKKRMILWNGIYVVLLLVVIAEIILFGPDTMLFTLLGLCFLFPLLGGYMFFVLPRIQYRSLSKLRDAENSFTFYDSELSVVTNAEQISGESKVGYSALVRVFETSRYLFVYQTGTQVFLVDKSTITCGTSEDIRNAMMPYLGKKYVICNY